MRSDWRRTNKQRRMDLLFRRCHDMIFSLIITMLMLIMFHTNCERYTTKTQGDMSGEGRIVSFNLIGMFGKYTGDYQKVWKISERENAEQRFIEMIEEPRFDTKLYALMGLKIISSDKYDTYKDDLLEVQIRVRYGYGGCMITSLPVSDVVELIDQCQLPDPR